ncbi:MAG TPA: DUF6428 family protein [Chthoniobacterales bacterium]|jgi:hypothetical protein
MNLSELKSILRSRPSAYPRFHLPDGDQIPAHFHITEVGHVTKCLIDCGGVVHERTETCLLQTWLGDDPDHRLKAGTFAKILDLGAQVLPSEDLEVEVEYDCCVVAQYPIVSATVAGDCIDVQLGERHTDCLARRRREEEGTCCGSSEEAERTAAFCC